MVYSVHIYILYCWDIFIQSYRTFLSDQITGQILMDKARLLFLSGSMMNRKCQKGRIAPHNSHSRVPSMSLCVCVRAWGDGGTSKRPEKLPLLGMKGKVGLEQWRYLLLERGREEEGRLDSIKPKPAGNCLGYCTSLASSSGIYFFSYCLNTSLYMI